jgi:hypothetical protein
MAPKTSLNAKNLEALGAPRLAELLIEISTGSAAHKRRLRMELAGTHSSAEVAREVRKRLASIARARTFINWQKVKPLNADLQVQRRTIVDVVARDDPQEGFELIWQLLSLADPIFERSDDGSGTLIETFHDACSDAGALAKAAGLKPERLADTVFSALQDNGYGQYDGLIDAMAPALGSTGLKHLRALLQQWLDEPEEKPAEKDRVVIGWSMNGKIYEDEVTGNHKARTARHALQKIADIQGDVDAFIAQQPEESLSSPIVAAEIAIRLVAAQRAGEALEILDRAPPRESRLRIPLEWQLARTEALEALGRAKEAQDNRWTWFKQSLTDLHLRDMLKRLPDFDDLEAEEKAFAHAQTFPDVLQALAFFINWPAPGEAAKLVVNRAKEIDGDAYEVLTPAADALAAKHPLAATLALRAMIDFTLERTRSSRYKHAARHLATCAALAPHIPALNGIEPHETYVARLKRQHGKKQGFWSLVG